MLVGAFISGDTENYIVAGVFAIFLSVVQAHNQHIELKILLDEEPETKVKAAKTPTSADLRRLREDKEESKEIRFIRFLSPSGD